VSELIKGYEFYKSIQGTKYSKDRNDIRDKLSEFRKNLGDFTDKIFIKDNHFLPVRNGKGNWLKTNGTTISEYIWNRYKPQEDNSNLVIYFNASTRKNEGLFLSIGLIDDRVTEYEREKSEEIYEFLEQGCKKISINGFQRKNTGWGDRVFSIVDEHLYEDLDYSQLLQKLKNLYDLTYTRFYETRQNQPNQRKVQMQPLNQILYGPPGTGKTYHTINKAIEIIENRVVEETEDRTALKEKFEAYKQAGQIEFVTFHQSYGYEEFVEGIKAKTTDNGIEYKIEAGIFKKLSNKAKENYENSKKTYTQLIQEKTLKQKIEQFLNDALEEQIEFTKTKGGKFKIKDLSEHSISIFTEDSNYSENIIELDIEELTKIFSSEIDIKTSRQLAKDIFGINNQRQRDTYYFSMFKKFKEVKFDNFEEAEVKEPLKNYILIIDEINRGNISKIFGELITLIEPSKRIGAEESLHVRLPYSNESFGVPSNLYIIGTMNTADRSIALMDTALRRRFDFTEMMPRPEVLDFKIEGLQHVKPMLETINKRIEYLYDRDHTIGHAYFMSLKDTATFEELDTIFRNKIIPLLQEYFYDDWEKIVMVLGNGFIEKSEIKFDIFTYKNDDYIEEEQAIYTIKDRFDFSEFQK
jgi:5-methylcytosine-specific restriction protein B